MARGRMLDKVIILSKKINSVSEGSENLYYRLLVCSDDYGRYHADPEIIKGQIYTRRKISISLIKKRLNELWKIGLIKLYKHDSEAYLEITRFENHQKFRSDLKRRPEYPEPSSFLQRSRNELDTTRNELERIRPSKLSKVKLSKDKLIQRSGNFPELAILLEQKIKEKLPRHHFQGRQYKESWANTFRIMIEKKESTEQEIRRLIGWIFDTSDFWYKNILSADTLRKRFGRLWAESGLQKEEEEGKKYEKWIKEK